MKEEEITQLEAKVDLLRKIKSQISELTRVLSFLQAKNNYINIYGSNNIDINSNILDNAEANELIELIRNYLLEIKGKKQDILDSISLFSLMADIEKEAK